MAYEIEGISPSHSFGDNITFNVFHLPPIVDYCLPARCTGHHRQG